MATNIFTQANLDAINEAIGLGHKKVRLNNREVEYQSVNQMIIAARYIQSKLNEQSENTGDAPRRPRVYRARTCKGY